MFSQLTLSSQLQDALGMFAFLAIELSALFLGISLLIGALQRHIPPARIETLLTSNKRSSYLLAAGLGAITPFCSCSTIPMLKGLIRAHAGFGPMMVFLFASPLLNPIVVVLLLATFGANLTMIYVLAAFCVSLGAGWLLQKMGFADYVHSQAASSASGCDASTGCDSPASGSSASGTANCGTASCANEPPVTQSCCAAPTPEPMQPSGCCGEAPARPAAPQGRYHGLWQETWSDFVEVLPYLFIGITIGSVIYGYMPAGLLEQYAGPNNPFAIPIAAVIGVPLYIRAEAVIPLSAMLMSKGVGTGTVLALIIGSAGASLTELILLRSLFKFKLLSAFVVVIFAMAIIAGYAAFLFF